jgi:hypothetical protein
MTLSYQLDPGDLVLEDDMVLQVTSVERIRDGYLVTMDDGDWIAEVSENYEWQVMRS